MTRYKYTKIGSRREEGEMIGKCEDRKRKIR